MEYIELNISVADAEQSEIMMALLSDFPFESFSEEEGALKAYIQLSEWEQSCHDVEQMLSQEGVTFSVADVQTQNWNAEWESSFEAVDIAGERPIRIRAEHHAAAEQGVIDVVIAPRMSFGTGHHTTTALMSATIAASAVEGKVGLDMGCGTGVLAIVALKCGAERMIAVDIDDWACDSCHDSIALSGVAERVDVRCGSIDVVAGENVDFILANINRNILQMMMAEFAQVLNPKGWIAMSGFLQEDAAAVAQAAREQGLEMVSEQEQDGWVVMVCKKL
ncbi:MAG: 50S ribosomal protein L11 methyltransferase [Alistipes sp.]|nr:50S ribosomal protein L11 methyltransferase [Alistipes sp.]